MEEMTIDLKDSKSISEKIPSIIPIFFFLGVVSFIVGLSLLWDRSGIRALLTAIGFWTPSALFFGFVMYYFLRNRKKKEIQ